MKALILTRILKDLPKEEIEQSGMLKIAVNNAPVRANYRVFHDSAKWNEKTRQRYTDMGEKLVTCFGENPSPYIHLYYKPLNRPSQTQTEAPVTSLFFYGGSIIPAIDLAVNMGAADILLVADNTAHYKKFQDTIKENINRLKDYCNLYCFSKQNNFDLPYKNLTEFLQEN